MGKFIVIILIGLFLAGCSMATFPPKIEAADAPQAIGKLAKIPQKLLRALVEPIENFTRNDTAATLKWVDEEAAAKKWDQTTIAEAKACPNDVNAVLDLLDILTGNQTSDQTTGALILRLTQLKYSARGGVQEQMKQLVRKAGFSCSNLIPADRFMIGQ